MAIDLLIMNAWKNAALDLGIRVVAPFEYDSGKIHPILFEAYLLDFGSREGAIVMSEKSRAPIMGKWSSDVYESHQTYSRQVFIETLDDWGWYGNKAKTPPWYSGKPWTSP
ncbi:MAG: hypothetical protein JO261_12410 [Alphaproteobacteria bacterium]|nr:hypothetical protein [Alphaproteobacteria bacterium]MBV9694492.1 hypothetical protein [Alphaproteobacteria bacterium]